MRAHPGSFSHPTVSGSRIPYQKYPMTTSQDPFPLSSFVYVIMDSRISYSSHTSKDKRQCTVYIQKGIKNNKQTPLILPFQLKKQNITNAGKIPCVPFLPAKVIVILNLSFQTPWISLSFYCICIPK